MNNRKDGVILVGAGGQAASLAEFAQEEIAGYFAKEENPDFPFEWLGNDDTAQTAIKEGNIHIAFIYHGLPVMKQRGELINKYRGAGWRFKTLIAPTAIVTPGSRVGAGSAIMAGAIINRAELGENCVINTGAIVEHDCKIGENTFVGPGSVIGGFVNIGKNCFIGLGAKICNGVRIGDNITVAMGAIVTRNLEEPGIYHGPNLKLFRLKQ